MLSRNEIMQTIQMIDQQHLDIRTITMGISLLSCADPDPEACCRKIYDKICRKAERLVPVGETIEAEFGIPIVNKRISVTPIALVAAGCETSDYVPFAKALDRAAKTCGVNFIGGYSALVQKGMTEADRKLMDAIPEALAETEFVCSSVNVGSTRAGINMDAVRQMGQVVKKTAQRTADRDGFGCAKLVVFCNAVGDSVAHILEEMGLEVCGTHGTTAALALLNDAVKKGGVMASSSVGGLSGAFIPVSEDEGMIAAARSGALTLDKLEAMTCVCSVGLDMIAVPGDTSAATISAIIADEAAIGMVNNKTTAVRIIPAPGKGVGDTVEMGGLLGSAPVMPVHTGSVEDFIARGGRIPAPLHSLKN